MVKIINGCLTKFEIKSSNVYVLTFNVLSQRIKKLDNIHIC